MLSEENKAIIAATLSRSDRKIVAMLYSDAVLQALMNAVRQEEQKRVQGVLEEIKRYVVSEDLMGVWDDARRLIAEGNQGSLPRDMMENALSTIWELADDELFRIRQAKDKPHD